MSQIKNYTVFETKQDLYAFIAHELKRYSLMPSEQHICLSGGSTPKGLFAYILAHDYMHTIQWHNLHFWWGDERCVPSDSSQSNYGEAMRLLFSHIDIKAANIHSINIVEGKDKISLKNFSDEMYALLPQKNNYPSFDWVFLGLGDDGHTASLFPNVSNLDAQESAVLVLKPDTDEYRISLSANTLRAAKRISYLVSGSSKSKVVKEILTNQLVSENYPAALISSELGQTEYLLDQQAGSLLQIRGSCQ